MLHHYPRLEILLFNPPDAQCKPQEREPGTIPRPTFESLLPLDPMPPSRAESFHSAQEELIALPQPRPIPPKAMANTQHPISLSPPSPSIPRPGTTNSLPPLQISLKTPSHKPTAISPASLLVTAPRYTPTPNRADPPPHQTPPEIVLAQPHSHLAHKVMHPWTSRPASILKPT